MKLRGDFMAAYRKGKKIYFKGKYLKEDGTYQNYNRYCPGITKLKEAELLEQKFLERVKMGEETTHKGQITFIEVCDKYVDMRRRSGAVKGSTIIADKEIINKLKEIYHYKIALIKPGTLQKIIDDMDAKGYKEAYINKFYHTLNKIFKYAKVEGYVSINPMERVHKIKRPDEIKDDMKFWTYEEYKLFHAASNNDCFSVCYDLLYLQGLRKGEALALTWNDIDFAKRTLRVNKTITYRVDDELYKITPPKTKNSIRTREMSCELIDILQAYKKDQEKIRNFNENGFVFGYDKPLVESSLDRNFKAQIIKANKMIDDQNEINENKEIKHIRTLNLHALRHSHASYLLNAGANMLVVASRLGDTPETIMKVYAHMFPASETEIMDIMNSKYKGAS